jgi:hypothetical protein
MENTTRFCFLIPCFPKCGTRTSSGTHASCGARRNLKANATENKLFQRLVLCHMNTDINKEEQVNLYTVYKSESMFVAMIIGMFLCMYMINSLTP